jgi:hypothetical protein
MAMSDYLEGKLADHVLRGVAYTPPSALYVALYTTDPTDADTGTEVSGGAYTRKAVVFDAQNKNNADITFPEATADWGTITHIGIRDAETGGNLLAYKALGDEARTIFNADQLIIKAGTLIVNFD